MNQRPFIHKTLGFILGLLNCLAYTQLHAQSPETSVNELMRNGQVDQALSNIEVQLAKEPGNAQWRFLRGVALSQLQRDPEAIDTFSRLSRDYPTLAEPLNNLAVVQARSGQLDEALTSLRQATRLDPGYAMAHHNMGDVLAQMSANAYAKAVEVDPQSDTARSASFKQKLISGLHDTNTSSQKRASTNDTDPQVQAPNIDHEPIRTTVLAWADAWSRQDVEAYLAAYIPGFAPGSLTHSQWRTQRTQRIKDKSAIKVSIKNLDIQLKGRQAIARFEQDYRADQVQQTGTKTLVLEQLDGQWRIAKEDMR